ncbi:hypothetical protein PPERSA_12494 [Pseudocohnilembus persalinus]|uniref:Uncharacterized protein n=1 Tax=Pseudocohnilembus persalinus TaxID=266149 RepID=A0A0V0QNY0_PSEPJ|nr:hypothetical protein PPERSA_12494 [Pseudocohnilembus persalinus]|eukprot:KRX04047.1 hypothetical protein PPERSA_12494 [Pseudocohnilembus persalinus]
MKNEEKNDFINKVQEIQIDDHTYNISEKLENKQIIQKLISNLYQYDEKNDVFELNLYKLNNIVNKCSSQELNGSYPTIKNFSDLFFSLGLIYDEESISKDDKFSNLRQSKNNKMNQSSNNQTPNRFDMLYAHAKFKQVQQARKVSLQKQQQQNSFDECTFQPNTNHNRSTNQNQNYQIYKFQQLKQRSYSNNNLHPQYSNMNQNFQQQSIFNQGQSQFKHMQSQQQNCSPDKIYLNNNKQNISISPKVQNSKSIKQLQQVACERLYQNAKQKQAQQINLQKEKENDEIKQLSQLKFTPKINKAPHFSKSPNKQAQEIKGLDEFLNRQKLAKELAEEKEKYWEHHFQKLQKIASYNKNENDVTIGISPKLSYIKNNKKQQQLSQNQIEQNKSASKSISKSKLNQMKNSKKNNSISQSKNNSSISNKMQVKNNQASNTQNQSDDRPLFAIEVNISKEKTGKVHMRPGDDIEKIVNNFNKLHRLSKDGQQILRDKLYKVMELNVDFQLFEYSQQQERIINVINKDNIISQDEALLYKGEEYSIEIQDNLIKQNGNLGVIGYVSKENEQIYFQIQNIFSKLDAKQTISLLNLKQ